ncbi:DUF4191 domain-containing protein [Lysinibacter cavernae]|uniref:DUF4191 domain-containing protein n=1 Tax=Lysinibacter cavernae TaxID=1640652 RepID=A0A7X5TSP1_9MICO|nr:DUF4191 domain-containing protein [Lysinibacter cavernae]NIH52644.1 hypothetical protein [Lysinibacter cavernae]
MAKSDDTPKPKKVKKQGRISQMWQVFQMTRRYDKNITLILLLCLLLPLLGGISLAVFLPGGILGGILWVVSGIMVGILLVLIVLGRRAERAAYQQIEGEPGAVGAVVKNALRRTWRGSEMPVAVNPRTKDAVYRVTGRGGVVLIAEGPKDRVQRMLTEEERKVKRVLPAVAVTHIIVGPDEDSVPLWKVSRALLKIKPTLTRQEVQAVGNRLSSLQSNPIGIPKGVDPTRVRAPRPR